MAQAKWIKATVNGTITGTVSADNLNAPNNPPTTTFTSLTFIIQNYAADSNGFWQQSTAKPNYTQLFGYGSGTGLPGLNGNYNASTNPGINGSIIKSAENGSGFVMSVGAADYLYSGLYITRTVGQNITQTGVSNFGFEGNLNPLDPLATPPFFASYTSDIVDFLSAAINNPSPATSRSFTCTSNCIGQIQPAAESPITFSWTTVTFERIDSVPGPLPALGLFSAFGFSRKLRARIKK